MIVKDINFIRIEAHLNFHSKITLTGNVTETPWTKLYENTEKDYVYILVEPSTAVNALTVGRLFYTKNPAYRASESLERLPSEAVEFILFPGETLHSKFILPPDFPTTTSVRCVIKLFKVSLGEIK